MPHWLRRLERGPFESAIALAGVLTAIAYLADPHTTGRTAVGRAAHVLLPYWITLYGVGGVVILAGMLWGSLRVEVAGLFLLAAALAVNAIATVNFYGVPGFTGLAIFLALLGACALRIAFLMRAYRAYGD